MKGFVNVLNTDIKLAIANHLSVLSSTKAIRDKATLDFYEKYYTNSGWWNRWKHRNMTADEFFDARTDGIWFVGHDRVLGEFLTKEERITISIIRCGDKNKREELLSLLSLTTEDTCLLGEEYSMYVNKCKDLTL